MYPIGAMVFTLSGVKVFTSSNAGGWLEKLEISYKRTRSGPLEMPPPASSMATSKFKFVLTAMEPRKSLSGKTLGGKFLMVTAVLVARLNEKQARTENEFCDTCLAQNVSPAPKDRPSSKLEVC